MPQVYTMQTKSAYAKELLKWLQNNTAINGDQEEEVSKMIDELVADCLGVSPPDPFDMGLPAQPAMDSRRYGGVALMQAIRQAEMDVKPYVGEMTPQRSPEAVYRLALDAMGVSAPVASCNRATFLAMARLRAQGGKTSTVAMDSRASSNFAAKFPSTARIVKA